MIETSPDFLKENPTLTRREILIQDHHSPPAKQRTSDRVSGPGADHAEPEQAHPAALFPCRIDGCLAFARKRIGHDQDILSVLKPIPFHHPIAPAEQPVELEGGFLMRLQRIHRRQMNLMSEITVDRPAQHGCAERVGG